MIASRTSSFWHFQTFEFSLRPLVVGLWGCGVEIFNAASTA